MAINLTEILKESVQKYDYHQNVNEVEWEDGRLDWLNIEYRFETENYTYGVNFSASPPNDHYIDVKFGIPGKNMKTVTNEGNIYRIMNTVVETIKDVGMNWGSYFRGFKFSPALKSYGKSADETQRGKVYIRYIKKAFPNANISVRGDMVYIEIR